MLVVYVPMPTEKAARELASSLIEHHLIACANIVQSTSLFKWKGTINNEQEWIMVAKTTKDENTVRAAIEAAHPYECPCILTFSATANRAYHAWVNDVLSEES